MVSPRRPQYGYRVVKTFPHDRTAFTQGLEYRDGFLYEGTGMAGRSSLRKVELATGRVLQQFDLPQPFFGEGITVLNQQILELTWTISVRLCLRQSPAFACYGASTIPAKVGA